GPPPGGNPHPLIWPAALFLGIAGFSDTVSAIFRSTILQVATPDAYRGRLQGVFTVVVAGGPHLGALVLGSFASRFGEDLAAVVGGILCAVAVVVVALRQKGLLAYDVRDPGTAEVQPAESAWSTGCGSVTRGERSRGLVATNATEARIRGRAKNTAPVRLSSPRVTPRITATIGFTYA